MIRILCTGDIHIGRRPSRLPESITAKTVSAAAAWERMVDFAVTDQVDLVILTGDVVDRANRLFEAFGPLERGIKRLREGGIPCLAVSGNHDFDVLPRLVESLDSEAFHLLGPGGHWERFTFSKPGQPAIHIDGWSFPTEHFPGNPLDQYAFDDDPDAPIIGLLHADLDQTRSSYAPVSRSELSQTPANSWLLGHIHRPQLIEHHGTQILYPGSLQGLDPGEEGVHGPWLIEVHAKSDVRMKQLPHAWLRYESLDVDLGGEQLDTADAVADYIPLAVKKHLDALDAGDWLQNVIFRLRLTGATPVHLRLDGLLRDMDAPASLEHTSRNDSVSSFVDKIIIGTRPALDLDRIAAGTDAPATLAKLLLAVRENPGAVLSSPIGTRLQDHVAGVRSAPVYSVLPRVDETAGELSQRVLREGERLLDWLLAQKHAEGA